MLSALWAVKPAKSQKKSSDEEMDDDELEKRCNQRTVSTLTTLTTDVKVEGRNTSDTTISPSQELEAAASTASKQPFIHIDITGN